MACHALIPAAGSGARLGAERPKQYLPLLGRPLLWHTLRALDAVVAIERLFVILAADDAYWNELDWSAVSARLTVLRCGGATRAESVANGLAALRGEVAADDWILVHDAARCCVTPAHVEKLIEALRADAVGGLLALPVADTLKHADTSGRVDATVAREGLWQAQTPQMFRYQTLCEALAARPDVTDEAAAIEALGLRPKLIAADATNLKVTWPLDLKLAEWILVNREV